MFPVCLKIDTPNSGRPKDKEKWKVRLNRKKLIIFYFLLNDLPYPFRVRSPYYCEQIEKSVTRNCKIAKNMQILFSKSIKFSNYYCVIKNYIWIYLYELLVWLKYLPDFFLNAWFSIYGRINTSSIKNFS